MTTYIKVIRVANGWIVEMESDVRNDRPGERFVFSQMGSVMQPGSETLFGFIADQLRIEGRL